MAKVFGKDTYIWLIDDEDAYHPARVKATFQAGNKGTVTNLITEASYTVSAAESRACIPMDEQSLNPIQDMVLLKQLDEPALLHNLRLHNYSNLESLLFHHALQSQHQLQNSDNHTQNL